MYFIVVFSCDCNNIVVSLLGAWYKFKYYDLTVQLDVNFLVSVYFPSTPQTSVSMSTEWRLLLKLYCRNAAFSSIFNLLLKYKIPSQFMLYQLHPHKEEGRAFRKSLAFLQLSLRWGVILLRQKGKEKRFFAIMLAESS